MIDSKSLRRDLEATKVRCLDDLADTPRWVTWRQEERQNKEGKTIKVKLPYNPNTGRSAKIPTDPSTYGTREEAERRWSRLDDDSPGGVGIVLGAIGGITLMGIDLDGCIDPKSKEIAPWADEVLDRFNTYSEISPSGTGIKSFFLVADAQCCALFADKTGKERTRVTFSAGEHREIAIDRARYYAVTGWQVEGVPTTLRRVTVDDVKWFIEVAGPAYMRAHGSADAGARRRDESTSGYGFRFMRDRKAAGVSYEAACSAINADQGPAGEWARRVDDRQLERAWKNAPATTKGYEMVRASDVIIRPLDWLWPGHLLRGAQELLTGSKGLGKSQLQCDLVARVTTGRAWPDGQRGIEPGNVIIVTCEDSLEQVEVPRLMAANADLKRVYFLKAIKQDDKRRMFLLGEDLDELGHMIEKIGDVALVAIDPLTAFMGKINSHSTTDVRGALGPLADLAGRHNVAVSTVTHPPKQGGARAMDHFIGSQAFITAARIGHICQPEVKVNDNGDVIPTGRRLFSIAGSNHQIMPTLVYRIDETTVSQPSQRYRGVFSTDVETVHIIWRGEVAISADEAVAASTAKAKSARADDVDDFLREVLRNGKKVSVKDIYKEGDVAGFSEGQIKRAKERIGVQAEKEEFHGPWVWFLPERGA
jgi:AAA domain